MSAPGSPDVRHAKFGDPRSIAVWKNTHNHIHCCTLCILAVFSAKMSPVRIVPFPVPEMVTRTHMRNETGAVWMSALCLSHGCHVGCIDESLCLLRTFVVVAVLCQGVADSGRIDV